MTAVSSRLLRVYQDQPLLIRRKAEFALVIVGLTGILILGGGTVAVLFRALAPAGFLGAAFFLSAWVLILWHLLTGRLEGAVNLLGAGLFVQCVLCLPLEISRTFFTFCLFSLVVLPVLAVRPYQSGLSFAVFPGLVLAKGLYEFLQISRETLARDTREQTILTLLVFLVAVPVVHGIVSLVGREVRAAEVLLEVNQTLRREAGTDRLTGTWNRRHFESLAKREIGEARRTGRPLTLAFLDLDRFKEINDRFGHQAGDEVLAETVRALQGVLRQGDSLVRWGGDEFVALCPGAGSLDLASLGQKLLLAVRHDPLLRNRHLGISGGLAVWDGNEPVETLLARADALLYRAKSSGRDRICVDPGDEGTCLEGP